MRVLAAALTSFALATVTADAAAPEAVYPARPVRLIVGPAAGGPTDIVGRTLTPRLAEIWGQPVVVDNRPGRGNTIATTLAAKAAPDGHTLLLCPFSDAV